MSDSLATRMKGYEQQEGVRHASGQGPVILRADGRGFSRFTRGMKRPYDQDMANLMVEVTRYLVEETGALVGYTQSDEITLVLHAEQRENLLFGGRWQKLASVVAGLATARFVQGALALWPERCDHRLPVFDCRAFEVPTMEEAANVLLWRERDATKNAITMAASVHCSHKELLGLDGEQRKAMMMERGGISFEDYPARFKRGAFLRRESVLRELTEEELARIPLNRRPEGPVERHAVREFDLPPLDALDNRVGAILLGEEPRAKDTVSLPLTARRPIR